MRPGRPRHPGPVSDWHNTGYRHCGIGYRTPESVHYGLAAGIGEQRVAMLAAACAAYPERFIRAMPKPPALPAAVDQPANDGGGDRSVIPDARCLTGLDRRRGEDGMRPGIIGL